MDFCQYCGEAGHDVDACPKHHEDRDIRDACAAWGLNPNTVLKRDRNRMAQSFRRMSDARRRAEDEWEDIAGPGMAVPVAPLPSVQQIVVERIKRRRIGRPVSGAEPGKVVIRSEDGTGETPSSTEDEKPQ